MQAIIEKFTKMIFKFKFFSTVILYFVLLTSDFFNSSNYQDVIAKYPNSAHIADGWQIIVLLFLFLVLFAMAILYSIAYAFAIDKLKTFAKAQILEILVSILFMMFLFGVLLVFDELASAIARQVAKEAYGLTNPSNQKLEFHVDVNRASPNYLRLFTIYDVGDFFSKIGGLIFAVSYPRLLPAVISGYLTSQPVIQFGPGYQATGDYVVMKIDPSDYRAFAEGILRKNIFCLYTLWENGRKTLVPLTIARSFSLESGGFDPSTGAALQIPIDLIKKVGSPTVTLSMFLYALIHLLRLITVLGPFLIIIGMILRSFTLTRPIGAFILALGIVMWIFFPLSIVVFMGNAKSFASKCIITPSSFTIDPCSYTDFNLFFSMQSYVQKNYHRINNTILRAYNMVVAMWQETILGFLATLVFTFTLTRALSGIFGSDISEIGRGLIKFV